MSRQGFSKKQKEWIRRRDMAMSGGCVLCGRNPEERALSVHHVVPFRYATRFLDWGIERANLPVQGVGLCRACHSSYKQKHPGDGIHPDVEYARKLYAEDRLSFVKMEKERDALVREGKKYWNPTHDEELAKIAVYNTLRYIYKQALKEEGERDLPPWDF